MKMKQKLFLGSVAFLGMYESILEYEVEESFFVKLGALLKRSDISKNWAITATFPG